MTETDVVFVSMAVGDISKTPVHGAIVGRGGVTGFVISISIFLWLQSEIFPAVSFAHAYNVLLPADVFAANT